MVRGETHRISLKTYLRQAVIEPYYMRVAVITKRNVLQNNVLCRSPQHSLRLTV